MLNSRQLQHFLAIVDEGSMGRAARRLNITEPALSKSIRTLEETLQVSLFDRNPRGLEPTIFGASLMDHARAIVAEMKRAEDELRELRGAEIGHIYVGSGPSFAASFLPHAIAKVREAKPGIRISVLEGYCDTLLPKVVQGELDLAMVTLDAATASDPELVQDQLWENDAVLLVRAGHPLAEVKTVNSADLASADWMLMKKPDLFRMRLEELFVANGHAPPKPSVECASAPFIRQMLLQSDLITFLPQNYVADDIAAGTLVQLDVPGWIWRRPVGLVSRRRGSRSPAARLLIKALHDLFEPARQIPLVSTVTDIRPLLDRKRYRGNAGGNASHLTGQP